MEVWDRDENRRQFRYNSGPQLRRQIKAGQGQVECDPARRDIVFSRGGKVDRVVAEHGTSSGCVPSGRPGMRIARVAADGAACVRGARRNSGS
jgi:hypothetical protein